MDDRARPVNSMGEIILEERLHVMTGNNSRAEAAATRRATSGELHVAGLERASGGQGATGGQRGTAESAPLQGPGVRAGTLFAHLL